MAAYVVSIIEVSNQEKYQEYIKLASPTVEAHGGRYLVRNGTRHALEGRPIEKRLVVLEFPSVDAAKGWYFSHSYQAAMVLRTQASTGDVFIVEGALPPGLAH